MKLKEESEKVGLKLNIQKTNIMASGPITSWQRDGETVSDFIFLGSKITADGDCSHEIKRCLFLRRKIMTNLDSMLKSRDIILPTKVHLVKAMVSPVLTYGCGLPWWLRRYSACLQCGRPRFDPRSPGKIPWRRKWQSTPVLVPGKSHGQRTLVGYSPWDRRESDMTE